jgi:exodeoxyribonuclease III
MTFCSGKTKEGNKCTKKIKETEIFCHIHKTQPVINNIQPILLNTPKINNIKPKIILPRATPKLKILTDEEVINLEKLKLERAKILNVWTFNINSVRTKMDVVDKLLIKHDIDILLLTETKIQPKLEAELKFHSNYACFWNSNKNSYHHGVCFIYKTTLNIELLSDFLPSYEHPDVKQKRTINTEVIEEYKSTIPEIITKAHNTEGRILTIKCTFNEKEIIIVGTYVPNSGGDRKDPFKRLGYRTLAWDLDLQYYLLELQNKYENIIWTGDLNVVIYDNDVLNIKANIPSTTFEERKNINGFLDENLWIDTWHQANPNIIKCQKRSTWGCHGKFPLRLDYVICSPSLNNNVLSSLNDQYHHGSDHYAIGTKFKFDI